MLSVNTQGKPADPVDLEIWEKNLVPIVAVHVTRRNAYALAGLTTWISGVLESVWINSLMFLVINDHSIVTLPMNFSRGLKPHVCKQGKSWRKLSPHTKLLCQNTPTLRSAKSTIRQFLHLYSSSLFPATLISATGMLPTNGISESLLCNMS